MNERKQTDNLLFQSEKHPLVPQEYGSAHAYCLGLIHLKAYGRAADMAAGRDVLDLGCNNGYGTRIIGERCGSIVGVDVSAQAIDAARQDGASEGIQFHLIDGRTLPFDDGAFDLVTSFQVIEHVEDVGAYLAEIARVLRPDGTVVFTTPNARIRIDPGMTPWNPFHVREYAAGELREALTGTFSDVAIEGLFATPDLYDVEYRRVQKALRGARRRRRFPRRQLIAIRESAPVRTLRGLMPRNGPKPAPEKGPADQSFLTRWSLDDLFYRDTDLDKSLDLIAVCRKAAA